MSIYTKRGDKGITDMARTRNISKSDDRIRLSGAIDELNSQYRTDDQYDFFSGNGSISGERAEYTESGCNGSGGSI